MQVDLKGFAQRVRSKRNELGLSQEQLACLMDVSYQFIGMLERGQRTPSIVTLVSLCYALNISPNALLTDSLPENHFEQSDWVLRHPHSILRNTLSNWVLADTPDETLLPDDTAALNLLPPLGFLAIDEDMPSFSRKH